MKPLTFEYNGEIYRYNKNGWFDEHNLKVSVVIEKKLNQLAKDKVEEYNSIAEELKLADWNLRNSNYDKAIAIYEKYGEDKIVDEIKVKRDAFRKEREKFNLKKLMLYKPELINYKDEPDAYINNKEHIEDIKKEGELGNYNALIGKLGKNERGLLGLIDKVYFPSIRMGYTRGECFYLEEYVPSREIHLASEREKAIISRVFALKDCYKGFEINRSKDAVIDIAVAFMNAIDCFSKPGEMNYLACVPCSDKNAKVPMNLVIEYICAHSANYKNASGLLKRAYSVQESSKAAPGMRPTYNMQHDSIKCDMSLQIGENDSIVILDDIVTTGTQMKACREVLVEYGYSREDIFTLAYAGTISKVWN